MAIKSIGPGTPITPASAPEATRVGRTEVFGTDSAGATRAASAASSSSDPALEQAVQEVAARVRAGEIGDDQARVDAVISRVVELRLGDGVSREVLRSRIEDARFVLGEHPTFAAHVGVLLGRALES